MHLPEPHIGMGTWGMGGTWERDPGSAEESVEVLRLGLSLGLKIIDTAEVYGGGLTEEIVGRAVAGKRQDAYIISKVWRTNMRHDDVLRAAEGSLKRLSTDYIDLYLVHWPSEDVPISETMRAMERLVDEKVVKAIGVSNFSPKLMEEAQNCLSHTKIAASQFEYNLASRAAEEDIIPYCRAHNIGMIAHRPFAKGALAKNKNTVLGDFAQKYNKTARQVVLNWIVSQGIVAIPKSGNPQHLRENAGALGWELSAEDISKLRAA